MDAISLMQRARSCAPLSLPAPLASLSSIEWSECLHYSKEFIIKEAELVSVFPNISKQVVLKTRPCVNRQKSRSSPLRIGVLFSGGPAPGQHNVVAGIYDAMHELDPQSVLLGFIEGPKGLLKGEYLEISAERLQHYRNSGGCDLLGSSRVKIETAQELELARKQLQACGLNGLVVIGGDDSHTNVAFLAEYLKAQESDICVIGVPKTIDGDLRNQLLTLPFGFDTACKVYGELVGNLAKDAISARKYYHFIRLMGRSASHIVLETALQTQPNLAFIAEEILANKWELKEVVLQIADLITERANLGKSFGVILIPEGIIEAMVDMRALIKELNVLIAKTSTLSFEAIQALLTVPARDLLLELPKEIQEQLLFDRDPHGNVHLSGIESEKLLASLVRKELKKSISFSPIYHFLGYEARSSFPSCFDCHYAYALGRVAALLIDSKYSGYMACVTEITKPVAEWKAMAIPIVPLMHFEMRTGEKKAVVAKSKVEMTDPAFLQFSQQRKQWRIEDVYLSPGPMQLPL